MDKEAFHIARCRLELKFEKPKLPPERVTPGSPPFTNVCLDLLGPTLAKGVINKNSTMKVWLLISVYQATGAIHLIVMHDYGIQAFLLQYAVYINLRAFADHEAPVSWGWSKMEQKMAHDGTSWEFVIKQTLKYVLGCILLRSHVTTMKVLKFSPRTRWRSEPRSCVFPYLSLSRTSRNEPGWINGLIQGSAVVKSKHHILRTLNL